MIRRILRAKDGKGFVISGVVSFINLYILRHSFFIPVMKNFQTAAHSINSDTLYTMARSRFDPHRKERAKYKKRTTTLLSKADELAKLCNADVYLIMSHPRGTTVYNSVESPGWPPPDSALVCTTISLLG